MLEAPAQTQGVRQVEQAPSRVNLAKVEVAPSVYDRDNRGVQAALLFADKNFAVEKGGKDAIATKLKGDLKDRYGWDAVAKASREERNKDPNKKKLPEWKTDMNRWFSEMKAGFPAAYDLNNQILHKMLDIPSNQLELKSEDLDKLARLIRNPKDGMQLFVKAAMSIDGINNAGVMHEIGNLGGVLFGEKISGAVVKQITGLELAIKNSSGIDALASELFNQGAGISANSNPEAVYLINELNKLINESKDRQNKLNQKISDKKEAKPVDIPHIAQKQILGGRPEQQDYTRATEKNLPEGLDSIAILADGHGKDGGKASKLGAQFFEAQLIEIIKNNPTMSMETAIKKAVEFADAQVIKSTPDAGTTIAAVIKSKGKTYVVNVGDSRVHQISQDGTFKQLTRDHRWAARGEGTYKYDLQLYRTLGNGKQRRLSNGEMSAEPDITVLENLPPGTRLVLSSDGMRLTKEEMIGLVKGKSAQEGVDGLLNIMSRKDPSDNVSAVVVEA